MKRSKKKATYTPRVDAELDLHGFTVREACDETRSFLDECFAHGYGRVRIIVGKGNRSIEGPVLPDAVKALLMQEGYDFTYAKIQCGGEGALEVII